ncbi:MAG: hypothetical protein H6582_02865 [Crocinitomicaceae bacterium]|nr:hypothetical protein [Crocinitomicaceae bacterium]
MKRILLLSFIGLTITNCGSGSEENYENVDLNQSLENLSAEINDPIWEFQSFEGQFEIEIPSQMSATDKLNPTAELQFGYTERFMDEVKENYIIILSDEYEEGKIPTSNEGLMPYAERSLDSLMVGKQSYELLNRPAIDSVNGMSMVMQEVKATIALTDTNIVDVFYVTGIYQGAKAHYQIVSWTLFGQKDEFAKDMRRMVNSFKETN